MQIRQVSAALDHKLAQLDQQLKKLEQEQQNSSESNPQLAQDILALQQIRTKLVKSKDIAWRAHQLQHQNDEQARARQRVIGLSLCIFSVVGAGVLLYLVFNQ
jgi:septal ring factor EnvC (AmiA/AmiB activator)